jgi:ABC-type spermidine/putrescine transport system permease subunit I
VGTLSKSELAIASWGVIGVLGLLSQAIYRLAPLAVEPLRTGMSPLQWALYGGWVGFNAYAEGYRGFQRSFSPRVVARAIHLAQHPSLLAVVLAPPYCMALFRAKRRRRITAWVLLVVIVTIVLLVRTVPQPWRGIIDAGVVVGLAWGALSIVVLFVRAVVWGEVPVNDSLPEPVVAE